MDGVDSKLLVLVMLSNRDGTWAEDLLGMLMQEQTKNQVLVFNKSIFFIFR